MMNDAASSRKPSIISAYTVKVASRSQLYRYSPLRPPPSCSGSDVVGAATRAPVGW